MEVPALFIVATQRKIRSKVLVCKSVVLMHTPVELLKNRGLQQYIIIAGNNSRQNSCVDINILMVQVISKIEADKH